MEINFQPSQKQFQAWQYLSDTTTTEVGYGGAAFGGKSYLGCFWQLARRLAYPETAGFLGRKDLINLKRTTLLTFFQVCNDYGIKPEVHFKVNLQNNTITFANGSIIFLFDLAYQPSDPLYTRLGGLELTDAFIDESNEVPIIGINILKTRIGRKNNDTYSLIPKLLEGFNPDKGHVYSRYYKPSISNTLPTYRKFIKALPTDNPRVTEEYLNQLRNADKVTRERLLNGNFDYDDDPTALIHFDAITDLFTNTLIPSNEKFLICDIARFGDDLITKSVWQGLELQKLYVDQKQGIDETADKIKAILTTEQIPYSQTLVDEDGIGGGVVDLVGGIKGFIANSTPLEDPHTGRPQNFNSLKSQCAYKLAEIVNSHNMSISPDFEVTSTVPSITKDVVIERIKEELGYIKSYEADKDGKVKILPKEKVKEQIGRSPDIGDVFIMRMYFELKKPEVMTSYDRVRIYETRRNNAHNYAR